MDRGVRVVKPGERTEPTGPRTPGLDRRQAFGDEARWVGYATSEPGMTSGWHHHGAHDTFLFILRGSMEFEFGPGGESHVAALPGDFVHVPAGVVHRESTPPGEPGEVVVFRVGGGPPVVPADGSEGS